MANSSYRFVNIKYFGSDALPVNALYIKYNDPIVGANADNVVATAYRRANVIATGLHPYMSMNGLIKPPGNNNHNNNNNNNLNKAPSLAGAIQRCCTMIPQIISL